MFVLSVLRDIRSIILIVPVVDSLLLWIYRPRQITERVEEYKQYPLKKLEEQYYSSKEYLEKYVTEVRDKLETSFQLLKEGELTEYDWNFRKKIILSTLPENLLKRYPDEVLLMLVSLKKRGLLNDEDIAGIKKRISGQGNVSTML